MRRSLPGSISGFRSAACWRHLRRTGRAGDFPGRVGISDPDRACAIVPARCVRRWLASVAGRRRDLRALVICGMLPHALRRVNCRGSAESGWMMVLVCLGLHHAAMPTIRCSSSSATAFVLILTALYQPGIVQLETARSFFGVHKVTESVGRPFPHVIPRHDAARRRSVCATTRAPVIAGRPEPVSYYHAKVRSRTASRRARAAGHARAASRWSGLVPVAMACHCEAGEQWRFFEIDPVVVKIAKDPTKFPVSYPRRRRRSFVSATRG